jgi:hypothetical protein
MKTEVYGTTFSKRDVNRAIRRTLDSADTRADQDRAFLRLYRADMEGRGVRLSVEEVQALLLDHAVIEAAEHAVYAACVQEEEEE